jgi:hypothetical protein
MLVLLCLLALLLLLLPSCRHTAAEMYVDVETAQKSQAVQWITESGVLGVAVSLS